MITIKQISELLNQPELLHQYSVKQLNAWRKQYPYFSLLQHLYTIKNNEDVVTNNIKHLYPTHPVLTNIIKRQTNGDYDYTLPNLSANDIDLVHDEVVEKTINIEEKYDDSEIEEVIHDETTNEEELILEQPIQDYFPSDEVDHAIPANLDNFLNNETHEEQSTEKDSEEDKSLMRVMSFAEWLQFLARKTQKEKEDEESKKNLKLMWQREKLSKAIEEETDEIPEQVFNMAVNSITVPDDLNNETMAEVYIKQGKYSKAIDIYRKLSLLQPEKNIYFASKIEKLKKEL